MATSLDNYYSTIQEIKGNQKEIKQDLITLKSTPNSFTTVSIKLEKKINDLKSKIFNYKESYLAKEPNVYNRSITERENIMRINQLESFMTECDRYTDEIDKITTDKFKYDKKPEDYQESAEVKGYSQGEYLMYKQRKVNSQDEILDSMIGLTSQNNQIGKGLKHTLEAQTVFIEKLGEDIDSTQGRVQKTNKRFETYLDQTSYCKLYIIILVQFFIILFLLF